MKSVALILFLTGLVTSYSIISSPQYIISNPVVDDGSLHRIPTSYESAVMARRILHLSPLGTLSTVFPSTKSSKVENRPSHVGGMPIGLLDYIADCESNGDPTILAINIATSFKNVAAGSNISLSLQWTPPPHTSSIWTSLTSLFSNSQASTVKPLPYSAASLPRFALIGHLERISISAAKSLDLAKCFTKVHPDAKWWLPGNSIHESEWVRLVVEDIYWVGGFGDRAYIGWIPLEEWRNVTREEWRKVKLPGEI